MNGSLKSSLKIERHLHRLVGMPLLFVRFGQSRFLPFLPTTRLPRPLCVAEPYADRQIAEHRLLIAWNKCVVQGEGEPVKQADLHFKSERREYVRIQRGSGRLPTQIFGNSACPRKHVYPQGAPFAPRRKGIPRAVQWAARRLPDALHLLTPSPCSFLHSLVCYHSFIWTQSG